MPSKVSKEQKDFALLVEEHFRMPIDADGGDLDDLGTGHWLALKHYAYCRWRLAKGELRGVVGEQELMTRTRELNNQIMLFIYPNRRNRRQLTAQRFAEIETFVNEKLGVESPQLPFSQSFDFF